MERPAVCRSKSIPGGIGKGASRLPVVERGGASAGQAGPEPGAGSRNFGSGQEAWATWAEMHAAEGGQEQVVALRKCTYAGRPFGD